MVEQVEHRLSGSADQLGGPTVEHDHVALKESLTTKTRSVARAVLAALLALIGVGQIGAAPAGPISVEVIRDEPMQRWVSARLLMADGKTRVEERVRLPQCSESWDRRCWQTTVREGTLAPEQIARVVAILPLIATVNEPMPPAPGGSHYSLLVKSAGSDRYATVAFDEQARARQCAYLMGLIDSH